MPYRAPPDEKPPSVGARQRPKVRAGDPPWWTELVEALQKVAAELDGDGDAPALWHELQLLLARLLELEVLRPGEAVQPDAAARLDELVRCVAPLPAWYVCDQEQRGLPCLRREPAASVSAVSLLQWAQRFARAVPPEPQGLSYCLGELRQRLLTLTLQRLTGSAVRLRASGRWLEVAQIERWSPETRAKHLQQQARLPKSAVGQLGPLLARATEREQLLQALLPVVNAHLAAPAWVLQPAWARRHSGSHYTPWPLCQQLSQQALAPLLNRCFDGEQLLALRVCDPAMGTGQFLLSVAECILQRMPVSDGHERIGAEATSGTRRAVAQLLYGVDADPVAVTLARLALAHYSGATPRDFTKTLVHGDAVTGPTSGEAQLSLVLSSKPSEGVSSSARAPALDWKRTFPEVFDSNRGGFDAVLGNPPWVAYVGRAAQPLEPAIAEYFRRANPAFARYRTLHGVFVYRSASLLRPGGRLGLILPTSVADLLGYEPTRAAHDSLCCVDPVLPDWGDGAFDGVFQPSMALLSTRRFATRSAPPRTPPWPLVSPVRDEAEGQLLQRLSTGPRIPRNAFGERGYQTSKTDEAYVHREPAPTRVALRVGAEVGEFFRRSPKAFVDPHQLSGRLRPAEQWQEVRVLIRQTARYPIACESDGLAFRNSVLAGFDTPECSAEALVGFLNSTLARWYHFQSHRDARQGMPQLKIGHLRALPALPDGKIQSELSQLTRTLSKQNVGVSATERHQLDSLVCLAFDLTEQQRRMLDAFGQAQPLPIAREPRTEPPPAKEPPPKRSARNDEGTSEASSAGSIG